MDPNHHYSQLLTYLYRIMRGITGLTDLNSVRLKYSAVSDVTNTTIIELHRDISDIYQGNAAAFAAQARGDRPRRDNQRATSRTQHLPGVEYKCMLCRVDSHTILECRKILRL